MQYTFDCELLSLEMEFNIDIGLFYQFRVY